MPDRFEKGELVRFKTGGQNRVCEIVDVDQDDLLVKWFGDGRHATVPHSQAAPFAETLADRKRPQKLKTVYAEFFGGRLKKRMRSSRLRQ